MLRDFSIIPEVPLIPNLENNMFYLIDKPLGISSFDVIRAMRKTLGIKKMWHAGTLDPLATGALLIATENSTKLLPLLDTAKKEYLFTVNIDGVSDSFDLWTPIRHHDTYWFRNHNREELRDFLLSQTQQETPKYSALHIDGKRAYELARMGVIFDTPKRPIQVHEVDVIEMDDIAISIRMVLSSGWYIRSFAPLIGKFFGMPGGYISSLRRTKIFHTYGMLDVSSASPHDIPMPRDYSQIFPDIPYREIQKSSYEEIVLGKSIPINQVDESLDCEYVFLWYPDACFISLVRKNFDIYTIVRNNV